MELKDTIELMNSADYKERFAGEYYQLLIRRDKLKTMVDNYRKGKLTFKPTCSLELLSRQVEVMDEYLAILQTRASLETVEL